jgi:geranylgeranyl diphosphate synthase type II
VCSSDLETLDYIHSHKTGALIRVSCTLGALLAGAGRESLAALADYGEEIGLAFQIVDDLLDVEGNSAELGKTAGSDQARGKATFPSVYGFARSRGLAGQAVARAKNRLGEAGLDGDGILASLADFIIRRRS